MKDKSCVVCKIVSVLLIAGALNWGFAEFAHINLVDKIFAPLHLARVVYALVTLAGLAAIASCIKECAACKK